MLKNLADMFRSLFGRRTRKSVAAQRRRDFLNQFRKGRMEGLEDRALMAVLGAGDLALVGYDTSGSPQDNFSIVALKDMDAGTTFFVNDNEVSAAGALSFNELNEMEAQFTVKAGQSIPAGTVINLPWGATAVSTTTYDWTATTGAGLGNANDELYFYNAPLITSTTATSFITFGQLGTSAGNVPSGLTLGTNAVDTTGTASRYKVTGATYTGSASTLATAINDAATNWEAITAGQTTTISPNNWTFTVGAVASTTTALTTVSPLTVNQGDSITFSGTVDAGSGTATPTGTIQIRNGGIGGTLLASTSTIGGTGVNGTFSFSSTAVPPGTYSGLQAFFVPTGSFSSSNSSVFGSTLTVNAVGATTTTGLNSISPLTANTGDNVTFVGTVVAGSGTATPVGTIEIRNGGAGGTLLASTTTIGGTGVNGTFSISSTAVPAGTYNSIQAFFVPGVGFQASNSAVFGSTLAVNLLNYVSYGTVGSTYAQNFDALINTGTATPVGNGPHHLEAPTYATSTVTGWHFSKYSGTGGNALFTVDTGVLFSGSIYSYGANSAADRALGSVASGSTVSRFGAIIRNTTGSTLGGFTLTFDGEQWRDGIGSSAAANVLNFEYAAGVAPGGTIDGAGFTADSALNFTAPVAGPIGGTEAAVDGNVAGKVAGITKTISGINWAPGTDLIVRWNDLNDTGNDDGLGIDNFQFSATAAVTGGTLSFSSPTYNVTENGTTATVTVNRVGLTQGAITVDYSTVAGGTAVAGTDYTTSSGTLNWAANDATPQSFTIPILDNATLNANKTINIALSNPTGGAALAGTTTGVVTIRENEQAAQVLLNEVVVNPPTSNDRPYEFIEVRGTASTTLGSYYVAQIDGGAPTIANTGVATFLVDLSSATLGSNGLLVVKAANGGHATSAPTTVVGSTLLDIANGVGLSNNAHTIAIIFSPTPLALNQDLDTNDDGTLDLPAGAVLVDAVGWKDNSDANAGLYAGRVYGGVEILNSGTPATSGTPDAASRFSTNSTPLTAAAWYGGDLLATVVTEQGYDPAKATANLPSGAATSPGSPNAGFAIANAAGQAEGSSGLTPYTFTITRLGDLSVAADVTWTVTGSGANPATAADFENGTFPTGVANFAINDSTKTITVNVAGDATIESDEGFTVTLSNPTNGSTIASGVASSSIINDDMQTLTPGEVVITGFNSTNPDQFSFVPLVNLLPNSQLIFTDNAYNGTVLLTTEGELTYTVPAGGITAGTKIVIEANGATSSVLTGGGTVSSTSGFAFNGTGDNLFVYNGSTLSPTYLFGITTNNAFTWDSLNSASTTNLAPGLTVGTSAVAPLATTGTIANAQYTGSTTGTATDLRNLVADKLNWTTSATALTLNPANFTLGANLAPSITAGQSFTVAESAATGSTVGTVVASDPNGGQTLSYAFVVTGSPTLVSGPFTISATTGQITVTGALDFETTPSYSPLVRVTDNGSPALSSTDTAVTINVSDRSEGRVFIPTTLTATAGGSVVVPVNLQVTEVDGAAVSSALIRFTYDSTKLTFGSISLVGGPLAGFTLDSSGSSAGTLVFSAVGTAGTPITSGTTVTLANVTFNVSGAAATGATTLNLQAATNISDATPNLFGLSPAITNGADTNVDGTLTISAGPLAVSSITPTPTGFVAAFNQAVNPALINLYDQTGAGSLGATDVTLVGSSTGAVRGSLLFNSTNTGFTFIKTGSLTTTGAGAAPGTLAPDTYTLTLRSNTTNGFVDLSGNALRDFGGTAAGDYITTFNVTAPVVGTVTLSVPDFARGYGQTVKVPNPATTGIPVILSNGSNVSAVDYRINFDPALLSITNFVTTIVGASAGFTIVSPGVVQVTLSSATALSAGSTPIVIGEFEATVPNTAPYGSKHILSFSNVAVGDASININPVPTIVDNGVHVAAYFGDVNGSQSYSAADTGLIQRAILGVNTGFTAFQNADPFIAGDINHSLYRPH